MINEIIKKIRLDSGYSQAQLAKELGIASSTLSGYEIANSEPNFDMVVKIADICDFDIIFVDRNSGEQIIINNAD